MSLNDEIRQIVFDPNRGYECKLSDLHKLGLSKAEALVLLGSNPDDEITLRDPLGGLPPLYLVIEKKYFDQILAGTKTEEYRSLSETTLGRYTYLYKKRRYLKPYDSIRLCVGYHTNREEAFVEVNGIICDGGLVTYKLGRILGYKSKE